MRPLLSVVALIAAAGAPGALAGPNGLTPTPPRGYSSWNLWHRNISARLFTETADALVASGLAAKGYTLVALDGGWWEGVDTGVLVRNATGFAQEDAAKFPDGVRAVADYVHARGLKWGAYTDAGTHACNGDAPMSEGFEAQDAALFASWGVDSVKVDACSVREPPGVVMQRWSALLNNATATGARGPIALFNCRNGCLGLAGWEPWCGALLNSHRTSQDIAATWPAMLANLDSLSLTWGPPPPPRG